VSTCRIFTAALISCCSGRKQHRQRRGHPDALQEHHHLLDRLLFLPGVGDRGADHVDRPIAVLLVDPHISGTADIDDASSIA
jgi:hypothetical protein